MRHFGTRSRRQGVEAVSENRRRAARRATTIAGALLGLGLTLVPAACGDGTVIFSQTNLGTVAADATCAGAGGHFSLREQSGLTVLVVLDGTTTIVLTSGAHGHCPDVRAGMRASVQGDDVAGHIRAKEVQLLG